MQPLRGAAALASACLLLCLGCSESATKPSVSPSASAFPTAEVQQILDKVTSTRQYPGIVFLVRDEAGKTSLTSGLADIKAHQRMTPEARFRIGSLTKSMVATVVLQLVAEQRLSLSDTVQRWLPGLVRGGSAVTIKQLLSHTSGLPEFVDAPGFAAAVRSGPVSAEQLVRLATAQPVDFAPGEGAAYSNTNFILLGLIVEKATGQTVENLLDSRIFQPLDMVDTTLRRSRAMDPPLAHGYANGKDVTSPYLSWAWTAGGVVSTASDVSQFYEALLGGRLLPPDLLQQMTARQGRSVIPGVDYGLGIMQFDSDCGRALGHRGSIPGFTTDAWTLAKSDRSVVVMVNRNDDLMSAGTLIDLVQLGLCS